MWLTYFSPPISSGKTHITTDKGFKCKTCSKSFARQATLERHERSHQGLKPYKCDTCGKCFTDSSELKTHTRTHTGEKPFKCTHPGCGFETGDVCYCCCYSFFVLFSSFFWIPFPFLVFDSPFFFWGVCLWKIWMWRVANVGFLYLFLFSPVLEHVKP